MLANQGAANVCCLVFAKLEISSLAKVQHQSDCLPTPVQQTKAVLLKTKPT